MTAQGGLKAIPAHGKVFYIDSGVTPKVDAAYVGYRIENSSGSTITGLWVSIESFVGGKQSLANPLDQYQQMDPVANSAYKTAFYLLKASGPTTISQTHTIKVFNKRPDLSGATALLTCDFSFSQIQETIKANSNKVTSVTGALSPSTATLGGTLTVSVAGDTGKVGAGKNPDLSIIWVSPAAVSTWPTRSLRLESTRVDLNCRTITDIVLIDTLIQSSADTCFTNPNDSWTASYVFRIIGPGPASLAPSPIANIASGTQYKHSDITSLAFGTGINLSGVATSAFTVNVTASSTVISSTSSSARIRYTITLSTTSTTAVEVDEVIDRPASGTTLVTNTSTLNGSAISDPLSLASESALSPPPLHYIGPYSVVSGTNVVIVFDRNIPCASSSASYSNTSYAKTGDQILGSATTTIPGVTVTTLTSGEACGTTVTDNPQTISPTAQTSPATLLTSSGATLNGYANAYGQSSVTTYFKYSTDRNLVNSVTATTAVSLTGSSTVERTSAITGLASGTTYYFQIAVTSSITNVTSYGATLSFTTEVVQAIPTVVTSAAMTVTDISATLNGHVNPNLTSITKVQFIFGLTSASVTDNSATTRCETGSPAKNSPCIVQVDNGTGALTDLTLTGSGQTEVSYDVNGLTAATTYFFKLQVLCTSNATYCPGGSVSGAVLQFKTGAPQVVTSDATAVAETTATLNGSMSSTGSSVKYQFYYCAAGASCSAASLSGGSTVGTSANVTNPFNTTITHNLTGLTGNTTYYYQAQGLVSDVVVSYGEILNFTTILISTASLANGTIGSSYTAGLTGTGGVGPYSWSSGTLPAGLTMTTAGVITGTPTTAGTTAVVFTMADDFYGTSTTKTLNIVVKASVTYALNGGSGTLPTEVNHAAGETFALAASTGLTKSGYTFSKWNNGTTDYNAGATYTMGSANTTLTAVWAAVNYTVLYNDNVADETISVPTDAGTYNIGQTVTISGTEPTRTGYAFAGWTTDSGNTGTVYKTVTNASYTVSSSNITFYAKWSVIYTLTYDGNTPTTGNPPGTAPYTSGGAAITVTGNTGTPVLAKTSYTFGGWYSNTTGTGGSNYSVGSNLTLTANKTIYALWVPVGSKTVTFNSNYGSATTGTQFAASSTALTANAFTRTGYTFANWNTLASPTSGSPGTTYANNATYDFVADLTLYAQWTAIPYTITYANGGGIGTLPTESNKNYEQTFTLASGSTLSKTGSSISGWNDATSNYSVSTTYTMPASNVTLTAQWVAVSYTITYANGGGSGTLPTQVNKEYTQTFSVASGSALTKSGYTFAGWNDGTSNYVATDTYTMPAANVTLTAQWTASAPTTYTITYSTTGSDGGSAPSPTTGNGSVTLRTNTGSLAKSGYVLSTWNTSANCGGTAYSVGGSFNLTASLTLYPCFVVYVAPDPTPEPEPQPRNNVVAKVKPVVVWKNPNAIKTTTALSTTQLNAVATTSSSVTTVVLDPKTPDKLATTAPTIIGTYVYTPVTSTVVTAGVTQVTTITSAANALTGTTKIVPTTTAPSTVTNTTSSTNIEEKPVLGQGTTLAPGLQKMKVVFIPVDSVTYEPAETIVEILVQAETKINWVEPTPIKKNTPVGPAQLNAVGVAPGLSNNVPGSYKYDVPEGTTLAPGKYPVKVIFTPTDPNYLPSSGEAIITVFADINPLATPIVTPSNTPAGKPITNTTAAANAKVTTVGKGLTSATTDGTQVNIVPTINFSGKTTVTVSVTDEGETKEVTVPVTVLPLAAINPQSKPDNKGQSTISWKASPNAISYEVTLAGKAVCTTSATSCSTPSLLGPKSDVQIVAKGNDETLSPLIEAAYKAPAKPITALVVYFDTNKFNLDAKDKAEIRAIAKTIIAQGFKNIVINGHTDKMTGVDNKVLSNNRANATYEYLKELATGLNVTLGAFASTKPAIPGNSAVALAANRRAEVGVY